MDINYYIEQGMIRKLSSRAKDNECHICRSTGGVLKICPICNQKVCFECRVLAKDLAYIEQYRSIKKYVCPGCVEISIDK